MGTILYLLASFSLVMLGIAWFALHKDDLKNCLLSVLISLLFFIPFVMLTSGGHSFNFPPTPNQTCQHEH